MYLAAIDQIVADEERGHRQRRYAESVRRIFLGIVGIISGQIAGQAVDGTKKFARECALHLLTVGVGRGCRVKPAVFIEQQTVGEQACKLETASRRPAGSQGGSASAVFVERNAMRAFRLESFNIGS